MKTNNFQRIVSTVFITLACCSLSAQISGNFSGQGLTFREYLDRVGKKNLSFLAEKLNVSIADAEVIAQKVLPDPEIEFEAADESFSLGVAYSVELGKRGARVRLAKSAADYEKLNLEYFYQELRSEAAELFLEAILQRELYQVKIESYEYMRQLSQSDSLRFIAGEITENDARQSKLEAVTLLNEVFGQQAEYQAALIQFGQFMGLPVDTLMEPVGTWEALSRDFQLTELVQWGLERRIDLIAARKNIEISRNEYRLAKAERRPDIGLSLLYDREWRGFIPPARSYVAGVSVPLKFSNLNKGELRAAQFRMEQTGLEEKDLELQIQAEIAQAWYFYQAEKKKVAQYQAGLLEESQKVLDGMVYTYQRGETGILDVLIAQRTHNEVREEYLETMKGYVSSLVELEKVTGIWDLDF